jgi:hypothetical protein
MDEINEQNKSADAGFGADADVDAQKKLLAGGKTCESPNQLTTGI